MARRRRNTDKGIQSTPDGLRAAIRIHGKLHRKRYKPGTDPLVIRQWLLKTEIKYRGAKATKTGRFADDAAVYLEAVAAMPTFRDRKNHIEEWIAVFGNRQRADITPDDIRAQLQRWRTEPRTITLTKRPTDKSPRTQTIVLSASAVNKRRTALMHLYTVLDGKSGINPVRDVPKFREPDALPKGLSYDAIRQLWAVMGDTKTRARLQVLAYTGIPHAQLKQIQPGDVTEHTVTVHGRRKGAGTQPRVVPLTPDGVRAFKAMQRTEAWGGFSNSQLRRDFQKACKKVDALKANAHRLTPYDLRHSFGTEVYRISGDIRATQVLLGHSKPTLTHRYTLGAVDARLIEALRGFGYTKPPLVVSPGTNRALSRGEARNIEEPKKGKKKKKPKKSGAPEGI